jgi:quinohemoprotein ethanol dehydrogenase
LAWDPIAQKARWKVTYRYFFNAGTMTTAGNLVFQGINTGQLFAYAADSGKLLWSYDAKLGIMAPPISYSVDGRQYISLLVGYGGQGGRGLQGRKQGWKYRLQPRRLLTFALDGSAQLPETPAADFSVHPLDNAAIVLDPMRVQRGSTLFNLKTCGFCHGFRLDSGGGAPDLRESAIALNFENFSTLLRTGVLSRGMPRFDDLSDEEVTDIYQYIRQVARSTEQSTSAGSIH